MLSDLRYAFRTLFRSPGFTAVAVLVLALGIGANTAVFSVINAVLLRPLPYPESDRLVIVRERTANVPTASVDFPDYLDWRATQRTFTDLAVWRRDTFNLSYGPLGNGAAPERVNGSTVSANYLTVLGVPPTRGRDFTEAEDTPGGPKAVLISDGLWRRRFGANPAIIGQSLTVEGEPREIVGVLPESLANLRNADIFVPLAEMRKDPGILQRDEHPGLNVLGRLRPGVTLAAAQADLDTIAATLEQRYPETNTGWRILAKTMLESSVGEYRQSLYLLLGAVGCVLLIACANVANLQLARAAGRTKELAVRAALGASRWRLVRQILTESALLGVVGGALGLLLAMWATAAIVALSPARMPRFRETGLDAPTLIVTACVALATGLLSGAWPAWRLSGAVAMARALHDTAARGASGGASQRRMRALLVVAQVALAVVLLAGGGLTLRAFARLQNEPLGFQPEKVLMVSVSLPESRYPEKELDKLIAFHTRLLEQVRAIPGVRSAALAGNTPFSNTNWQTSIHVTGTPPAQPGENREVHFNLVTADYFKTLGMPIVSGRDFGPEDVPGRMKSVVIDEVAAQMIFPNQNPVGQHIDDTQTLEKCLRRR